MGRKRKKAKASAAKKQPKEAKIKKQPKEVKTKTLANEVKTKELQTHGHTVSWTPERAFRPGKNIEDLVSILEWVHTQPPSLKVKAGGSRGSWTAIANTDGIYIHPQGISFVERVKAGEVRKGTSLKHLYRVGAGTTIGKLHAALWQLGSALPTSPGSGMLTIAGAIMTGTHASVLTQGPLGDLVRSIDLVKADGTKARLEPKGGLTDAKKFKGSHRGWELVQDNDTFDAALISMGTMGVVHSYVLKVRERFWMKEIRTKTKGKKVQGLLRDGGIYRLAENAGGAKGGEGFKDHPVPAYYLEMLWNPHSDKLIVTTRHPVSEKLRKQYEKKEPQSFRKSRKNQVVRMVIQDKKHSRPLMPYLAAGVGKALVWASSNVAKVIPGFMKKAVDMALDGMVDKGYTQRSYNVFDYGELVNKVPGQAATISLPLRGDMYLDAIDIMRKVARKFAKKDVYQSGAISWRFVKGSRAILGAHEDVCRFEIIFGGANKGARRLARKMSLGYYKAIEAKFGADARFHWGHKIPSEAVPTVRKHLKRGFPRYERYVKARKRFDPHGRFLTPWQQTLFPDKP